MTEGTVEIYKDSKAIVTHKRNYKGGSVTTIGTHRHPDHQAYLDSKDSDRLLEQAQKIGTSTFELAVRIFANIPIGESSFRSVRSLLALSDIYELEDIEAACQFALSINSANRRSVVEILQKRSWEAPTYMPPPSFTHANLRNRNNYETAEI